MPVTGKSGKGRVITPFVLILLLIMFAVEFVKGALLLTILPLYMGAAFGAGAYVVGWTLAAQYIGDNALRTPVGWLLDKIGCKACMLVGMLLAFGAVLLIATTSHAAWTIAACAMLGLGTAPLWPCVITAATEAAGDEAKGTVMSVVHVAALSGAGLGPVTANFFIQSASYAPAFRLLLGFMIAVVLVALLLPRRAATAAAARKPRARRRIATTERARVPWTRRTAAYWQEVRRSLTVSPLLFPAMFLQTFAIGILTPILTLYTREQLALSPRQTSLLLVAGGAVTVLLLVPAGKLVDRIGTKLLLSSGFALGSAALLVFTLTRSIAALYGIVAAFGCAFALIIPSWNALLAAAIPNDKRGAVWGLFLTIEGCGAIAGPIVSGKLWDVFGPHVPFFVSGSVLGLLFFLQLLLKQQRKAASTA
jgi:MFS family permease